jgi:hypothetical protein
MGKDKQGFENGIYKDISPEMGSVDNRASLLRAVSKRLLRANIDKALHRQIVLDLCWEFGIKLSEHGIEHFLDA